ncbi:MAG: transcription elongation factor GreA [Parcubacteria group bacterium]|nr:transcription elongation factor GreA [Parcubacteria group bacterium]
MNDNHEYLTQAKFDQFKAELENLKTNKRREIAEALAYASSLGDKSENAEYHEARDSQAHVEDRINHLEAVLKNASIVSTHDTNTVTVGSVITISKNGVADRRHYTIVGSEEADAMSGKISTKSPLGSAALGKSKGESFSFQTPQGMANCVILEIE